MKRLEDVLKELRERDPEQFDALDEAMQRQVQRVRVVDALALLRQYLGKVESHWPNEPIGGGNPYYRCSACGRSDPEISYRGHFDGCEWEAAQAEKKKLHEALDVLAWALMKTEATTP